MSKEGNKAILRRMIKEVIVAGNLDLTDELVAPDFVNHNVEGTGASGSIGVESFRQELIALRSAVPDLAIDIVHLLADGDRVIAHQRSRGTYSGEFGGVPTTGKSIEVSSMTIVRIANGKLAERWNLFDTFGMLQQIGVRGP